MALIELVREIEYEGTVGNARDGVPYIMDFPDSLGYFARMETRN